MITHCPPLEDGALRPAGQPRPPFPGCTADTAAGGSTLSLPALSLKIHSDLFLGQLQEWASAGTPQRTSASLPSPRPTPPRPGQTVKTRDVTRLAQGHGVCHVAVLEPEPRSLPGLVTRALSPLPGVPALPVLALETVTARDAGVRHGLHGSRKEAWHSDGTELRAVPSGSTQPTSRDR